MVTNLELFPTSRFFTKSTEKSEVILYKPYNNCFDLQVQSQNNPISKIFMNFSKWVYNLPRNIANSPSLLSCQCSSLISLIQFVTNREVVDGGESYEGLVVYDAQQVGVQTEIRKVGRVLEQVTVQRVKCIGAEFQYPQTAQRFVGFRRVVALQRQPLVQVWKLSH